MSALKPKTKKLEPQVLENQLILGDPAFKRTTVTLTRQYNNGVTEGTIDNGSLYVHRAKNRKSWVVPAISYDYSQRDLADRHTDPYTDVRTGKTDVIGRTGPYLRTPASDRAAC